MVIQITATTWPPSRSFVVLPSVADVVEATREERADWMEDCRQSEELGRARLTAPQGTDAKRSAVFDHALAESGSTQSGRSGSPER